MSGHPQTIQIFLPSGDPQGIRVASITTRIVRVIDVPRSLLSDFLKMPEAEQVCVYFLIGENESADQPKVYVGQTGSSQMRLQDHQQNKEFWNRAVVAVSLTNNLTSTHVAFLEWRSIQQVSKAGRYGMENGNAGSRPYTPAPLEAECTELHETIRVLLVTLGYPIFESIAPGGAKADGQRIFYCGASEADARGLFTEEGFVVLKGSSGRAETAPSFQLQNPSYWRLRDRLLTQGVLVQKEGRVVFERDYLFSAPSAAASCVMGRSANGLTNWKDEHGRTLGESLDASHPA